MESQRSILEIKRAKWAKWTIFSAMKKQGLTYRDLKERLELIGVEEDERAIRNKIARGTFSAAFLFECLAVLGITEIKNDVIQGTRGGKADCALMKTLANLSSGKSMEDAYVDPDSLTEKDAKEYQISKWGDVFWPDVEN